MKLDSIKGCCDEKRCHFWSLHPSWPLRVKLDLLYEENLAPRSCDAHQQWGSPSHQKSIWQRKRACRSFQSPNGKTFQNSCLPWAFTQVQSSVFRFNVSKNFAQPRWVFPQVNLFVCVKEGVVSQLLSSFRFDSRKVFQRRGCIPCNSLKQPPLFPGNPLPLPRDPGKDTVAYKGYDCTGITIPAKQLTGIRFREVHSPNDVAVVHSNSPKASENQQGNKQTNYLNFLSPGHGWLCSG